MISLPLKAVLDVQNNGLLGAASAAGGIANEFTIPQDATNIVVKLSGSVAGGGVSTIIQTTDDGGSTWYDVARTSIVSNAISNYNPEWLSVPILGTGVKTTYISGTIPSVGGQAAASINGAIGNSPAASTLGQLAVSGLPFLSQRARAFLIVGAAVTGVASVRTQVYVNGQDNP